MGILEEHCQTLSEFIFYGDFIYIYIGVLDAEKKSLINQ